MGRRPPVNLPAPVRYFRPEEGGVSHFNYVRDNALLTWMHLRLFFGFLLRLPLLLRTHSALTAISRCAISTHRHTLRR